MSEEEQTDDQSSQAIFILIKHCYFEQQTSVSYFLERAL